MDNKALIIKFSTSELRESFAGWLSNSGEQGFYECREMNNEPTPTLDYHQGGGWLADGVIVVTAEEG